MRSSGLAALACRASWPLYKRLFLLLFVFRFLSYQIILQTDIFRYPLLTLFLFLLSTEGRGHTSQDTAMTSTPPRTPPRQPPSRVALKAEAYLHPRSAAIHPPAQRLRPLLGAHPPPHLLTRPPPQRRPARLSAFYIISANL